MRPNTNYLHSLSGGNYNTQPAELSLNVKFFSINDARGGDGVLAYECAV